MAEPNTQDQNNTPATTPEPAPEKTFTQTEMDSIIGRRLAKAMKGMPGEEELAAFRAWKEDQRSDKEKFDTLTKERDENAAALAAAQAELEQFKREQFLRDKGVTGEDVEFYAFKIGKLVTDELPFEKAAEQYLSKQQASGSMRVDTTAPINGVTQPPSPNEQMNNLIRGTRR